MALWARLPGLSVMSLLTHGLPTQQPKRPSSRHPLGTFEKYRIAGCPRPPNPLDQNTRPGEIKPGVFSRVRMNKEDLFPSEFRTPIG